MQLGVFIGYHSGGASGDGQIEVDVGMSGWRVQHGIWSSSTVFPVLL